MGVTWIQAFSGGSAASAAVMRPTTVVSASSDVTVVSASSHVTVVADRRSVVSEGPGPVV